MGAYALFATEDITADDIRVICDRKGISKGYAYAKFSSNDDASTLIGAFHGYKVENETLVVKRASPKISRKKKRT